MEKQFQPFQFLKIDDSIPGLMLLRGKATEKRTDKGGEMFAFDEGWQGGLTGKEAFQQWEREAASSTNAAGQEISHGNVRAQHNASFVAGKVTKVEYNDQEKCIYITVAVYDPEIQKLIRAGVYRGFSIAGSYIARWCSDCGADMLGNPSNHCSNCDADVVVKFVSRIVEISIVDNPCLESAVFTHVKADGTIQLLKFQKGDSIMKANKLSDAVGRAAKASTAISTLHAKMTEATRLFNKAVTSQLADLASAHADIGVLLDTPTYPDSEFRAPGSGRRRTDDDAQHGGGFDPITPTGTRPYGDPIQRVARDFFDEFFPKAEIVKGIGSPNYGQNLTD